MGITTYIAAFVLLATSVTYVILFAGIGLYRWYQRNKARRAIRKSMRSLRYVDMRPVQIRTVGAYLRSRG